MTIPLLFASPSFFRLLPISCPIPHKSARSPLRASANPLIIGLNQYTHDTSIAILDAKTGALLFALSKERLSRKKHDAGNVSELVPHALAALATPDHPKSSVAARVRLVIANNHHFRISPFERRLPLQVALKYVPSTHLQPSNLIGTCLPFVKPLAPSASKIELSHHLAHAFAAVYSAPFDVGLLVVMDGMGDALDDWMRASAEGDLAYHTEESLSDDVCCDHSNFRQFPADFRQRPGVSFREAETAYIFERRSHGAIRFSRVFKRWTPENAPSELQNHSFEEMESLGSMYSRVSAILFKDWNACGKVMGLAPYASVREAEERPKKERFFMKGNLIDGSLNVNEGQMKGLQHIKESMASCDGSPSSQKLRRHFENLAYHIQSDLEDVVTSFISTLLKETGQRNLVFAGGVALNSTLNGILSSNIFVQNFYVPPYPGDEGISIGCALFGYSLYPKEKKSPESLQTPTPMPYLGTEYTDKDIMLAVTHFSPWITFRKGDAAKEAAQALASSKVVAWFNGRSEFGPRALGNRSILADPRPKHMVDHVNAIVKKRETFRPFAPSVLSEYVTDWFKDSSTSSSPFMSLTKQAKLPDVTQAVAHVDNTSRLQTLTKEQNFDYHRLISLFHDMTGVPMVMNTSFNTAGEPIVESPYDAIKTFLNTDGIGYLMFPGLIIEKPAKIQFMNEDLISSASSSFISEQVQDSSGSCLRTIVKHIAKDMPEELDNALVNFENSTELIDGLQLGLLEVIHEMGTSQLSEIIEQVSPGQMQNGNEDCNVSTNQYSGTDRETEPSRDDILSRISDLFEKRLIYKEKECYL